MKIRKLLAAALVLVMVLAAVPVLSLAEGVRTVTYEARQKSKLDRVWAALESAEAGALSSNRSTKAGVIDAVYQAALNLENVDKDSFSDFTKDGFFFTVDGMACSYNYRLRNELKSGATPVPASEGIVVEKSTSGVVFNPTRNGNVPNSPNVLLIGPYYGQDAAFTDQYRLEAQSVANTTGGNYTLIQAAGATGPAIAQNMTDKGVVFFDSHGVQSGTSSYLCLTTTTGITAMDYLRGWAVRSGSDAYIDGRYIQNHINGSLGNCFVWMAICEGMKRQGQGTTGSALRNAGAGVVYGYSQSVSFSGDYLYEETFWNRMKEGDTVADAIRLMKATHGICDRRIVPNAYPIVMSASDGYPANPDAAQNVTSDWQLFEHQQQPANPSINSVTLNNLTVNLGTFKAIELTVTPNDASYTVNYDVANNNIATVTSDGFVYGLRTGSTILTATVRDNVTGSTYTRNATVTVTGGTAITSVTLSDVNVNVGSSVRAQLTVNPNNANYTVNYAIGNSTIATVNADGYVTGVRAGNTTLTATVRDTATGNTYTRTSSVTVTGGTTITSVTLSDMQLVAGSFMRPQLTVTPSNANYTVNYAIGNSAIATVTSDGYVFGVSAGTTILTATVRDTATGSTYTRNAIVTITGGNTGGGGTGGGNGETTYQLADSVESGSRYILVSELSVDGGIGYAVTNSAISANQYLSATQVTVNANNTLTLGANVNADALIWTANGNSVSGYTWRNVANNKYIALDAYQFLYPGDNGINWRYTAGGALDNMIDTDGYYYLSYLPAASYAPERYTTTKNAERIRLYKVVEGQNQNPVNTYTVTFRNWDGSVLKTQQVTHGGAATAPANPTRPGYTFTGWDRSFSYVTSDITVYAVFTQNNGGGNGQVTYQLVDTITPGDNYILVSTASVFGTTGYAVGNTAVFNNNCINPVAVTVNANGTLTIPAGVNVDSITWTAGGSAAFGYNWRNVGNNKFLGLNANQYLCPSDFSVAWRYVNGAFDNMIDTDGYYYLSYSNGEYTTNLNPETIRLYKVVQG